MFLSNVIYRKTTTIASISIISLDRVSITRSHYSTSIPYFFGRTPHPLKICHEVYPLFLKDLSFQYTSSIEWTQKVQNSYFSCVNKACRSLDKLNWYSKNIYTNLALQTLTKIFVSEYFILVKLILRADSNKTLKYVLDQAEPDPES